MGRSTPSCFRIISCAGGSDESVDRDAIDASSENKNHDKRGWSFRKRSARHRVLSNRVVTEKITSSENKQISEPIVTEKITSSEKRQISEPRISTTAEPQVVSNITEKTSDSIWTEEAPDLTTKNTAVATMATKPVCEEDEIKYEPVPDQSESAVLVIQAAVRRFLAERELVKHKNVVKLQAAVRGHLVRNHAVGTLRCVQAIVKMQALVRARREKGAQNAGINSNPTYISIEKLLSNGLARQLLESAPKTKQINIKCDPLKSDSAWNWLERWMSASSPDVLESNIQENNEGKVVNNSGNEAGTAILSDIENRNVQTHEEEKLITESMEKHDSLLNEPMDLNSNAQIEVNLVPENPVSETKPIPIPEKPISETKSKTKTKLIPENPVSATEPEPIPQNPALETKTKSISENCVLETEPKLNPENHVSETKPKPVPENLVSETETEPKRAAKRVATDQPDSEGRKSVFGRKASNPAFIAAQSRFEELTSISKPLKPANASNQDAVAGSGASDPLKAVNSSNQDDMAGSGLPAPEKVTPVPDVELDQHLVSHGSVAVQNGGSECGTELSITSTLDSPDQSEVENKKHDEPKVLEKIVDSNADKPEPEKAPEPSLHADRSNEHEAVQQISVPGSPRSQITTSEPQGTPSSQLSTNSKKSKTDKKSTSQKRKSWSTSKKTSADSAPRTSFEQLPKDTKPGKRRNSFGSPKPDHTDHESSVPSYMQATESARAKAVANSIGSPVLSPDVHDKETYLKKRHSLPGAVNGRQGSPRIQRSMSQALQTTKGNGNQERKWQR